MNMTVIEQVALRTDDIESQIAMFKVLGHHEWVRDTVQAAHLYKDESLGARLGDAFKVHLAFNYTFLARRDEALEFELIQLISGNTYQMMDGVHRFSHFGYHTMKNQTESGPDTLLTELLHLQNMGLRVMQVSQTVNHTNTERRYRYAYVTGHLTGNVPLKIIQRMLPMKHSDIPHSLSTGRKLFACLGD